MSKRKNKIVNSITQAFIRGLLVLAPVMLTVWALVWIFNLLAGIIPGINPFLSILIIFSTILLVGAIVNRLDIGELLWNQIDAVLMRTPVIKVIYSSIKDVINSFVGDKKKFDKPVMILVSRDPEIWRMGFVTKNDMDFVGMEMMISVYIPHSFAWSGNLIVVSALNIRHIDSMKSGDALKFIVTGGTVEKSDEE